MNNSILLQNVSTTELETLFQNCFLKSLQRQKEIEKETSTNEELLTAEETSNFLKISDTTLWRWTNNGNVKAYGIGSRRYYKKSEILNSLTQLKK